MVAVRFDALLKPFDGCCSLVADLVSAVLDWIGFDLKIVPVVGSGRGLPPLQDTKSLPVEPAAAAENSLDNFVAAWTVLVEATAAVVAAAAAVGNSPVSYTHLTLPTIA